MTVERTYDLLNAGPRNRFMANGRIVSNSGRLFQPQNMKRPDLKQAAIDIGIEAIKSGHEALIHADVMGLLGDVARGCIIAPPGHKLVAADLANIEGRMLAFLAGEEWKLEAFRAFDAGKGPDLYKVSYGRSFDIDPEQATGDKRQIGKVTELSMGFQGWVGAFVSMAAIYKMDLEAMAVAVFAAASQEAASRARRYAAKAVAEGNAYGLSEAVYAACSIVALQWREAHPATRALWGELERAFIAATHNEGVVFRAGEFLALRRDGPWLRMRLPSGRYICYLHPKVNAEGKASYMGVDSYSRKWRRLYTFGGKLTENAVSGASRDVLADAMPRVEAAGYAIVLTVHDEIITEVPDEPEFSADGLSAIMSAPIAWAPGLPLAAKGFEAARYRKD
jgi:DNA polymerase